MRPGDLPCRPLRRPLPQLFNGLGVRLFRRIYDPLRRLAHNAGERGNGVMPATRGLPARDAVAVAGVRDLRDIADGDLARFEDLLVGPSLSRELTEHRQIFSPELPRSRPLWHRRPPIQRAGPSPPRRLGNSTSTPPARSHADTCAGAAAADRTPTRRTSAAPSATAVWCARARPSCGCRCPYPSFRAFGFLDHAPE